MHAIDRADRRAVDVTQVHVRARVERSRDDFDGAQKPTVGATQVTHMRVSRRGGLGGQPRHLEVLHPRGLAAVAQEHTDAEGAVIELTPQRLEHASTLPVRELSVPGRCSDVGQECRQARRHVDAAHAHARQCPRCGVAEVVGATALGHAGIGPRHVEHPRLEFQGGGHSVADLKPPRRGIRAVTVQVNEARCDDLTGRVPLLGAVQVGAAARDHRVDATPRDGHVADGIEPRLRIDDPASADHDIVLAHASSRMSRATCSPTTVTGKAVVARGARGKSEASATTRPATPRTRARSSQTA